MKKIIITTALFLMLINISVSAKIYSPFVPKTKRCCVSGCDRSVTEKSLYCSNHKCSSRDCKNKRLSGGIYCAMHQNKYNKNVRNSAGSWHGGSTRTSSRNKSSFDPDDHDIEGYYEDNRDEYDDFDDAYDGFLDDDDAWDDY